MAFSLKHKTAIVTGASAGIGRETTILLAEAGVRVLAVARRKEKLAELQKIYGDRIEPVCQDLKDLQLSTLKEKIENLEIDILVNNAGLAVGRNSIEKTSFEAWNTMIDTNIKALIAVTELVLPKMIAAKTGDIVNLGSIAGMIPYASGSIYSATKAAVIMLTDAWRLDLLGKGIRVMGVHPGMVETEFSEVRLGGDREAAKKVYAGMTPLQARDIAEGIIWSLSRPRHVNIQSLWIMPTDQGGIGAIHRSESL